MPSALLALCEWNILPTSRLSSWRASNAKLALSLLIAWKAVEQTYDLSVIWNALTHWGQVMHICSNKLTIIGLDNGLWPGQRQAIIWTNAWISLIWISGTNFSEISSEIHTFSFKKMHLKMLSGKWQPFCFGLNELMLTVMKHLHVSSFLLLMYLRSQVHKLAWYPCWHSRHTPKSCNLCYVTLPLHWTNVTSAFLKNEHNILDTVSIIKIPIKEQFDFYTKITSLFLQRIQPFKSDENYEYSKDTYKRAIWFS